MWCSHSRLIDERALYSASIRQKPLHQAALALERVFPERGLSLAAVAHRLLSSISYRSADCISTGWYHLTCVMLNTR